MHKIKLGLLLILICVLTYSAYLNLHIQSPEIQNIHAPQPQTLDIGMLNVVSPKKKTSQPIKQSTKKNTSNHLITTTQEKVYEYSADPVIETSIINSVHIICQQHFWSKNNLIVPIETRVKKEVQRNFFIKASENCEELNKQHPEYGFDATLDKLKAKRKIKATTRFGKLLEFNKIPYSEENALFIYATLGRDYPELINSTIVYKTMKYQIDTIIPDLQQLLQATSVNYVSRIIHHTQNYLACELGVNCGFNSQIMMNYCQSEVNFCVDDFSTLINTRFSSGVRADIQVALPYFEKLYRVNK